MRQSSGTNQNACQALIAASNRRATSGIPFTSPLYPGTGQSVDLTITNPNPESITVPVPPTSVSVANSLGAGATANAIANCSPSANFAMTQGLTTTVTVPPGTWSLSDLSVPQADWPVISMIETHTNQDACQSTPLNFTWSGTGSGS